MSGAVATNFYADGFQQTFSDERRFMEYLKEREGLINFRKKELKEIKFYGLDGDETLVNEIMEEFKKRDMENVFIDTEFNTGLVIQFEKEYYAVRDTAIKTISEKCGIKGTALRKLSKDTLAYIFNKCVEVSSGTGLLHFSGNKMSAIHSDNAYSILNMCHIFQTVSDWLESNYPGYEFKGASANHKITEANSSLKGRKDLINEYSKSLKSAGLNYKDIEPVIRIITSDTGVSGANIYTVLKVEPNKYINLGQAFKTEHKYNSTVADFKKNLNDVFAQYSYVINLLEELIYIDINNPVRCMGEVMQYLKLPKKASLELIEEFEISNKNIPCSAHEIFLSISELAFKMRCDGADSLRLIQVEETIARALKLKWTDFDMPGAFTW